MKNLTFLPPLLTLLCITPLAHAAFPDVPASHTNADAIEYVQTQGIVGGYSDGTFRPSNQINRAEFTKIIVEATADDVEIENCLSQTSLDFSDVTITEWYSTYICVAKKHNLVEGYPDGTFRPENDIQFVEAAKIISIAFDSTVQTHPIWYKPYVNYLADKAAIPWSILSFEKEISRGEMAEIIYRLLAEDTDRPSLVFEDLAKTSVNPSTYSDKPLLENEPVMEYAKAIVGSTIVNNWLAANYSEIHSGELLQYQEELYKIIDSIIKKHYREKQNHYNFNGADILILSQMFSWGEHLSLWGAELVGEYFASLRDGKKPEEKLITTREPFNIELEFPYYRISSTTGGWSVIFPYYFMISSVQEFANTEGANTQLLNLSTLFKKHTHDNSSSQGSIMFVYNKESNSVDFKTFWLERFGMNESSHNEEKGSYYYFDSGSNMHTEVKFFSNSNGNFLFAFLGMPGSYEANRIHYINFIDSLVLQ
ncbi:MAG: S-layer homology domain-containing protein [Patescibacteria group bacterium]